MGFFSKRIACGFCGIVKNDYDFLEFLVDGKHYFYCDRMCKERFEKEVKNKKELKE